MSLNGLLPIGCTYARNTTIGLAAQVLEVSSTQANVVNLYFGNRLSWQRHFSAVKICFDSEGIVRPRKDLLWQVKPY